MLLEIGNKSLTELTGENILDMVMIIKACPSLEFWNEPILLSFNNTHFSDTYVIEYVSYRKSDNKKSCKYTFFFNFKDFYWHYKKDFEYYKEDYVEHASRNLSIKEFRYLIQQGFDIPLYNTSNTSE